MHPVDSLTKVVQAEDMMKKPAQDFIEQAIWSAKLIMSETWPDFERMFAKHRGCRSARHV